MSEDLKCRDNKAIIVVINNILTLKCQAVAAIKLWSGDYIIIFTKGVLRKQA